MKLNFESTKNRIDNSISIFPEIITLNINSLEQIAEILKEVVKVNTDVEIVNIKLDSDFEEELSEDNISYFFELISKVDLSENLKIYFEFKNEFEENDDEDFIPYYEENLGIRKISQKQFLESINKNRLIESDPEYFYDPKSYVELLNKYSFLISNQGFLINIIGIREGNHMQLKFSISNNNNYQLKFNQTNNWLNYEFVDKFNEILKNTVDKNKEIIEVYPTKKSNSDYQIYFAYLDNSKIEELKKNNYA